MSASLVGSEMCIRDRYFSARRHVHSPFVERLLSAHSAEILAGAACASPGMRHCCAQEEPTTAARSNGK
eukprot:4049560-Alexandrium_andersonii.AAC.1